MVSLRCDCDEYIKVIIYKKNIKVLIKNIDIFYNIIIKIIIKINIKHIQFILLSLKLI